MTFFYIFIKNTDKVGVRFLEENLQLDKSATIAFDRSNDNIG